MMKIYLPQNGGLKATSDAESASAIANGLWIDLIDPTPEERQAVNNALGMELPTHADMEEIEISSRLYSEDGGLFMTGMILANSGTEKPVADVVTFILVREKLITLRFIDPQPFRTFEARCGRSMIGAYKAENVLMALIDVIIDRLADILERAGAEIEGISREIFDTTRAKQPITSLDFRKILRALGRKHDLSSKIRDSLLSLARMLAFLAQAMDTRAQQGRAPPREDADARRAIAAGPFVLYGNQTQLSARRDARPDQHRPEQHHQNHVGRRHGLPAADPDRLDLGHELRSSCRKSASGVVILFRWW